jgi:hypothetical protein
MGTRDNNLPEDDVCAVAAQFVRVLADAVLAQVLERLERRLEPRFLSKSHWRTI